MVRVRVALVVWSFVLPAVAAFAAPEEPVGLFWRSVGRSSVLQWDTPGGTPVSGYEVRASDLPIDEASFADAGELGYFPTGTPRPAGVLELRELREIEVDVDEEQPEVLKTALYFAVRAVDAEGTPGPVAATSGFQVRKLRARADRAGRLTVVLRGRFATRRDPLDAGRDDLRVRLVQDAVTVFDVTIPAAALPPPGQAFNERDPVLGVRRLRVRNDRFAQFVLTTDKLLDLPLTAGPVDVLLDLGPRPFDASTTLEQKNRRLVSE